MTPTINAIEFYNHQTEEQIKLERFICRNGQIVYTINKRGINGWYFAGSMPEKSFNDIIWKNLLGVIQGFILS